MQELFRNWVFLQNFWILKFRIWWAAVMWNFPSDWKDWYSHTSSSAGKKRLAYVSLLLHTVLESEICLDYSFAPQGKLHLCSHLCTASGVTEAAQCEPVKITFPATLSKFQGSQHLLCPVLDWAQKIDRNMYLQACLNTLTLFSYSYEPELFPGLIYRMIKPRIVLLIFVSGKVVLTGKWRQYLAPRGEI